MGCTSSKADATAALDSPVKPTHVAPAQGTSPVVNAEEIQQQQQQQQQQEQQQQQAAVVQHVGAQPTPATPHASAAAAAYNAQPRQVLHDSASSRGPAFAEWAKAQASSQHITVDEFIGANTTSSGACYGSSVPPSNTADLEAYKPPAGASAMLPYTPYDTAANGAPKPACHVERDATATAVARMRNTRDGELEAVLGALCRAFNTDTAAVSLLTGDIISHIAACGIPAPSPPVCPQSIGFCGWSFVNTNHELLVIEDMKHDSRTADNVVVNDPFYDLSFYVGAPLITSDGHRLGTLCMTSQKPQKFDADRAQFLANMTEVVVRQLERRWARELADRKEGTHLARSLECYDMAYMLVDASTPDWRVIYMNNASQDLLGINWQFGAGDLPALKNDIKHALKLDGVPLEAFFDAQNSSLEWSSTGCEFSVQGAQGAPGTLAEGQEFLLTFKLATADGLDEQQPVDFGIGVPSHLEASDDGFGRSLFFVQLSATTPAASQAARSGPSCKIMDSSRLSTASTKSWTSALSTSRISSLESIVPRGVGDEACPVDGLVLGPLLGKGGYGRVYRGVYKGQPVAVKLIEDLSTLRTTESGEPLEAVLTRGINHLGIMRTVTYAYSPNKTACWMLFEYCDKTNVQDGVLKGWFRTEHSLKKGTVNLRTVALTAYEVASAMAFLHKHDIVHGDLKGGNVMLSSSSVNPHGFTAKVGDYGLARKNGPALPNNVYGTVTHMPPEVLLEGGMTKATDVYSFGVMLWEMLTASRAWAGMRHSEIVCQVAILKRQLAIPKGLPAALERLLARCLAPDMAARGTFEEVLAVLTEFLQATQHQDMSDVQVKADGQQGGGYVDIMSL